jgi:hypothetical protein
MTTPRTRRGDAVREVRGYAIVCSDATVHDFSTDSRLALKRAQQLDKRCFFSMTHRVVLLRGEVGKAGKGKRVGKDSP